MPARRTFWINLGALTAVAASAALVLAKNAGSQDPQTHFLNVSYDPTRELYRDFDTAFVDDYARRTGKRLQILQSHGGSSRQARAVIDGLPADVVTLALRSDIDALARRGLIAEGWQKRLPNDSLPYTSTIVFVVRKGNPKEIADWRDLVRPGVSIITPNPKTSGNGQLSFLAAWGSVIHAGGSEEQARQLVTGIYQRVAVLDSGARGAATTFAEEKVGDVHLTWENEALREVAEGRGELEIVYPPTSIRAEPYVAWVDANVARKHSEADARAYLQYLYSDRGQEIVAEHGYRPINPAVLAAHRARFPAIDLFAVTQVAAGWDEAQQKFFADGGVFDRLEKARPR
jgi:sulfate/thiosulfate transport system substrate-binding protein